VKGIVDWFDERTGIRALWARAASDSVPGGARFRYVFGSVLVYLFVQQVVLGVLLALYYSPSATDAWASTAYIQDRVMGGWFLRGLHHHSTSAMVVLMALHFVQVVWAGAYRRPREVTWWLGLALGGLVLAFALSGYVLPFDQKGYWASQTEAQIIGTMPGGEPIKVLLQGGSEYGNLTITRLYALHVFVLPLAFVALLAAHVALVRRHGVTAPELPEHELERSRVPYLPNQLLLDVTAMLLVGAALVMLTVHTHGAELYAPAQPTSNFPARPVWYFLFLFELRMMFEGSLEMIATVLIPGAAAVFLLALPWIDRAPSRHPRRRMPVLVVVGLGMAGVVALSVASIAKDAADEEFAEAVEAAHADAREARKWALQGVLPEGGEAVYKNDPEYKKKALFDEHCGTCHEIASGGGDEAPSLVDYSSRAWLTALVRNPSAPQFFGGTPHDSMDPYPEDELPEAQLEATVEYLVALMGDERMQVDQALADKGAKLFADELDCADCHEVEPGESGSGPNLHGHGSAAWIARVIRDPSKDDLFGEDATMPKFEGKLTDEEIEMLAQLVADQRHLGTEPEEAED
jgi:ubiquinol-cytochrome c reductase cytochrome b subunit